MRRRLALLLLVAACTPRPRHTGAEEDTPEPKPGEPRVVEIDLSEGAPESSGDRILSLPAARTYTGLVRTLERVLEADETAGVFVKLGNRSLDFARAEELGRLLARFRERKRPVVCHAHTYSNASALVALSGCGRIWISAAGSFEAVGLVAELVHVRGLLDKLKVQADFLSMGEYKGGAEPFTREEPSEETREAWTAVLKSLRQSWLEGAERGRPDRGIAKALEQGPYTPTAAKERGLVDAIGFDDEAKNEAKRLAKTELVRREFGPMTPGKPGIDIGQIVRVIAGADDAGSGRPRVAVVPAEGSISIEAGGPFESGGISARAFVRTLRRLREDESVRAVVLRIDSPGGSALASDLIWHEVMELRKKKPIVASVGSMAASGGYYIASGTNRVIAERTSIVGSIGVFGGKLVIGPALGELGIRTYTLTASPDPGAAARGAYLSPLVPWDDGTRERVREHMQSVYDLFVERVATGRKVPAERVRAAAEGRVWTGAQGKELGLVDELGGLSHALDVARRLANLDRDVPVTVEGPREGLLEILLLGEGASESEIRAALSRFEAQHERLLALAKPLRAHLGTLAPLLAGERVVLAPPHAAIVR